MYFLPHPKLMLIDLHSSLKKKGNNGRIKIFASHKLELAWWTEDIIASRDLISAKNHASHQIYIIAFVFMDFVLNF